MMTKWYSRFVSFFSCLVLIGCSNTVSPDELVNYINYEGNGLVKSTLVDGIKIELKFRPVDQIVFNELKNSKELNDTTVKEKRARYDKFYYFALNISKSDEDVLNGNNRNVEEFSARLNNLSFRLGDYSYIKCGVDTCRLIDFQLPRLYGMTKKTQLLLAFEKPKTNVKEVEVVLEDLGLGIGKQNFRFNTKDLESVPKLSFK